MQSCSGRSNSCRVGHLSELASVPSWSWSFSKLLPSRSFFPEPSGRSWQLTDCRWKLEDSRTWRVPSKARGDRRTRPGHTCRETADVCMLAMDHPVKGNVQGSSDTNRACVMPSGTCYGPACPIVETSMFHVLLCSSPRSCWRPSPSLLFLNIRKHYRTMWERQQNCVSLCCPLGNVPAGKVLTLLSLFSYLQNIDVMATWWEEAGVMVWEFLLSLCCFLLVNE